MVEAVKINKFFEELSNYYYCENDLSNIAVALCNSHQGFREAFIKFFFPSIDIERIEYIKREVPDNNNLGSRVDIYISMRDEMLPYIIEVKKGDRNHHFGQYEEAYGIGRDRFGYITNYECHEGKNLGYDVKTWEKFYNLIIDREDEFFQAFATYLSNTCGIIKYDNPMDISGLNAIPCFVDACKKIIEGGNLDAITRSYKNYYYKNSLQVGFTFQFSEEAIRDGFGAIGLWFYERPVITFGVNSRPWLSEKILQIKDVDWKEIENFDQPYKDEYWSKDDVWFNMSDEKLEEFNNASSFDEQVGILRDFINDVLLLIKPLFK